MGRTEVSKTNKKEKKPLTPVLLYGYHVSLLFLGFLLGLFTAYHFTSLNLHYSGDLEAAKRLGIVSLTILKEYPKSKDVFCYASMLGIPVLFSITLWSFWARRSYRRDLMRLFEPSEETNGVHPVGNSSAAIAPQAPTKQVKPDGMLFEQRPVADQRDHMSNGVKAIGWPIVLLSVIALYAFLSINVTNFFRTMPGWPLLGEEGSHLAYVQSILSGGVYGKDFSSPYGPMMIYPMVWLMKLCGATLLVARLYTYSLNILAHGLALFFLYRILRSKAIFFLSSMIYFVAFPTLTLLAPHWSYLRVILGLLPIYCAFRYLQVQQTYLLVIGGGVVGQSLLFGQEAGACSFIAVCFLLLLHHLLTGNWKGAFKESLSVFVGLMVSVMPFLVYFSLKGALPSLFTNLYEQPKYFAMGYASLPFPNLKTFLEAPSTAGAWFAYWVILVYIFSAIYFIFLLRLGHHHPNHLFKISILVFGVILFRSALGRSDVHHFHFVSPPAFFLAFIFLDGAARNMMRRRPLFLKTGSLLLGAAFLASTLSLFFIPEALKPLYDFVKSDVLHFQQKWQLSKDSQRFIGLGRGGVLFDNETIQTLTKISSFIQTNTAPHEYVYFFPNEAAYYFFFDRPNPTRYPAAYHTITREHRRELVADLEKKKPRFVIYSTTTARIDGIMENINVPEVVEYLHKEYRLHLDLKDILILKRIQS
jgi:hypothetical protein